MIGMVRVFKIGEIFGERIRGVIHLVFCFYLKLVFFVIFSGSSLVISADPLLTSSDDVLFSSLDGLYLASSNGILLLSSLYFTIAINCS